MIAQGLRDRRWRRIFLIVGAIVAAYALLAPLTSLDFAQSANVPLLADRLWFRIATYIAMFIVMATGWNIIGGITGYAAFGNVAFFGIGAYTTGMLIAKAKWPFLAALPFAPVVAALFAALVGLPLLRLRGHYFAVASLGVGVAVGELLAVDGEPPQAASTSAASTITGVRRTAVTVSASGSVVQAPGEWRAPASCSAGSRSRCPSSPTRPIQHA